MSERDFCIQLEFLVQHTENGNIPRVAEKTQPTSRFFTGKLPNHVIFQYHLLLPVEGGGGNSRRGNIN